MRVLLSVAILIGAASALTCPPAYDLMEGKCIRSTSVEQSYNITTDLPESRAECAKDGAHLPMIKNDEDDATYRRIYAAAPYLHTRDVRLLMYIVCNPTSRRLEWIDGTPITYMPGPAVDITFDCVRVLKTPVDDLEDDRWVIIKNNDLNLVTVLCVIEEGDVLPTVTPTEDAQCGDYSLMMTTATDKPCFKLFTTPSSWQAAQQQCAADSGTLATIYSEEENKFFWRSAISNNVLDGMHIANANVWTWIDGEVPITGGVYQNFISAFPIPGAGECGAMLTESTAANWINEDCEDSLLPFICRRADLSSLSKNCPTEAPKAGEDYLSPGFPHSDTPCEYVLYVAAKKRVELEVITLVAEPNEDYLEILEGPAGSNVLANLTGTIMTSQKFTTSKSNVLRVNWKPNGNAENRGFRIRYTEV